MSGSARSARVRAARIACTLMLVSPLFLAAPASAAAAPAAPVGAAAYAAPVREAALRFGIPEIWIWRVMHAESRGRPRAVSHAGAMGLMQIMPGTWAMLSARHRLGSDPFDVRANILGGAAYLRAMWDRYGDVRLMLAAYNAGPGRVDAYAAGRRGLPAETVAYVAAITPAISAADAASPARAPRREAASWRSASLFAGPVGAQEQGNRDGANLHISRPPDAAGSLSRSPSPALFVPLSDPGR